MSNASNGGTRSADETYHERDLREAGERLLRRKRLGSFYISDVRLLLAEINSLRESLKRTDALDDALGYVQATLEDPGDYLVLDVQKMLTEVRRARGL